MTTAEQWQQKAAAAAQQWEQQPSPAWDRQALDAAAAKQWEQTASPAQQWEQQMPLWMQQQYGQARHSMDAAWQRHAERELQRQQEQLCWRY